MAEEKERAHSRFLNASILSESTQYIVDYCGNELQNYMVRKKVEVVAINTFIHEVLDECEKENLGDVVLYRRSNGNIQRAFKSE